MSSDQQKNQVKFIAKETNMAAVINSEALVAALQAWKDTIDGISLNQKKILRNKLKLMAAHCRGTTFHFKFIYFHS